MKRFVTISLSVFVALILSSCAVTNTTHMAKTLDIKSEVIQMPTVVELDVSKQREASDVFKWTNCAFSSQKRIGVKEKTNEAIAQILDKTNADVLLEPKVSIDRRIGAFSSKYTLSVSGYPARYKDFRTATIEDVTTITTLRNPPIYKTLKLAEYTRPQLSKLPKSDRRAIAISDAITHQRWVRPSGYMGMVDAGVIIPCNSLNGYDDEIGISISTTHGYLLAHRFFFGLGIGYDIIIDHESIHNSENYYWDHHSDYGTANMINGYFNFRAYLLKRRLSPYLDARVGVNYSTRNRGDYYDRISKTTLYWDAGLGISYGKFFISGLYGMFAHNDYFKIKVGIAF